MTKRTHIQYVKKNNPCTALFRTRGFQEVKASRFQDNRHISWQGCQPEAWNIPEILLQAESTPEPLCGRKDYDKFQ